MERRGGRVKLQDMALSADNVPEAPPVLARHRVHCPRCAGRLRAAESLLRCLDCDSEYPVVDGVPVLIVEERSVFRLTQFTHRERTTIPPQSLRGRVVAALPSITLATGGPKHWRMLVDLLTSRQCRNAVLVVGAGAGA